MSDPLQHFNGGLTKEYGHGFVVSPIAPSKLRITKKCKRQDCDNCKGVMSGIHHQPCLCACHKGNKPKRKGVCLVEMDPDL